MIKRDEDEFRRERREHLGALVIALQNWREFCELIWSSASPDAAIEAVSSRFGVTSEQARVMLNMQFYRLSTADRTGITEEFEMLDEK